MCVGVHVCMCVCVLVVIYLYVCVYVCGCIAPWVICNMLPRFGFAADFGMPSVGTGSPAGRRSDALMAGESADQA